jgi:hypothetical protein
METYVGKIINHQFNTPMQKQSWQVQILGNIIDDGVNFPFGKTFPLHQSDVDMVEKLMISHSVTTFENLTKNIYNVRFVTNTIGKFAVLDGLVEEEKENSTMTTESATFHEFAHKFSQTGLLPTIKTPAEFDKEKWAVNLPNFGKLTPKEKFWIYLHEHGNAAITDMDVLYGNDSVNLMEMNPPITYENLYETNCIRTYTGKYVNVFEPAMDMIDIRDIAHALSNMPRWGGHTKKFFSVAQHSMAVAMMLPTELMLDGLLHDATEAYLMDIPSPIKAQLPDYKKIEDELMVCIARKFKITYPFYQSIKAADKIMLEKEWNNLVIGNEPTIFETLTNQQVEQQFLEMFEDLITIRNKK